MAVELEPPNDSLEVDAPVEKPSRRRIHLSALAFFAAAVLLLFGGVAILLPLPPSGDLQPYVSPPIDASGMRVKMQIPAGWSDVTPPGQNGRNGFQMILLKPPDRLPAWLTRFGRPSWVQGEPVVLGIGFQINPLHFSLHHPPSVVVDHSADSRTQLMYHTAAGSFNSMDGKYQAHITYVRTDKTAFDRTQKAVMDSVRIER